MSVDTRQDAVEKLVSFIRRHTMQTAAADTLEALAAERDAALARIAELEADMSSGSFYKEADVDWLIKRAEAAEAEVARLRTALQSCPPTSNPTLSPIEHLERITTWWRLTARPALTQEPKP